jgi:hypothetical protein
MGELSEYLVDRSLASGPLDHVGVRCINKAGVYDRVFEVGSEGEWLDDVDLERAAIGKETADVDPFVERGEG